MLRCSPRFTRTYTPFPYTTLFRSSVFQRPSVAQAGDRGGVLATTKGLPGPLDQPRQQRLQSLAGLDSKRERPAVLQFLAEPIYRRRLAAADLVQQIGRAHA